MTGKKKRRKGGSWRIRAISKIKPTAAEERAGGAEKERERKEKKRKRREETTRSMDGLGDAREK